jgi:hypothetical protein
MLPIHFLADHHAGRQLRHSAAIRDAAISD